MSDLRASASETVFRGFLVVIRSTSRNGLTHSATGQSGGATSISQLLSGGPIISAPLNGRAGEEKIVQNGGAAFQRYVVEIPNLQGLSSLVHV